MEQTIDGYLRSLVREEVAKALEGQVCASADRWGGKGGISVRELAEGLGISYNKANDMTRIHGFPVIHVGVKKVIPTDGLETWLRARKEGA